MSLLDDTRKNLSKRGEFQPPRWMRPTDDNLRKGHKVLREGTLRFGALVVHDRHLELPGSADGTGLVVFSRSPAVDRDPSRIELIVAWLRTLPEDGPNPELRKLRRKLERTDSLPATPIPRGQTAGVPYFVGTASIRRGDLPGRRLRGRFLPILEHEDVDLIVTLPAELWADDLVAAWIDLGS